MGSGMPLGATLGTRAKKDAKKGAPTIHDIVNLEPKREPQSMKSQSQSRCETKQEQLISRPLTPGVPWRPGGGWVAVGVEGGSGVELGGVRREGDYPSMTPTMICIEFYLLSYGFM